MTLNDRYTYRSLPPQMLSLKEKDEDWKKENMDILEAIGRQHYMNNDILVENYGMVKGGKFFFKHYIDSEEYSSLISSLTADFNIPSHLKHYDFISQVVNTLSGEYQERPDTFRPTAVDEISSSELEREKSDLLHQYVGQQVSMGINKRLLQQGIDPDKRDFNSQEEADQYQQELEKQRQAMTPPEIEKYMKTKFRTAAERWADHQMRRNKFKYNFPFLEKREFEDMLIADRCFRHFYLCPNGYEQETWHPVNTFFHKSPEVDYVEDGDYVGRTFYLTIPEIINRYGHKMTAEQLESLQQEYMKSNKGRKGIGGEFLTTTSVPFKDYKDHEKMNYVAGLDQNGMAIPTMDSNTFDVLMSPGNVSFQVMGFIQVTEAYWKSQRKIGKLTLSLDEFNEPVQMIVDETVFLDNIKVVKDSTYEDSDEPGTLVWTWINQTWKGVKINHNNTRLDESLYIDIGPADFEFKSSSNPYGTKLPVCGQIFNNRSPVPASLVDLMKPFQILYNVAMNQLFEIMQREIGRFMLLDSNFLPKSKDHGGEFAQEKFMIVAKQLGLGVIDSSPSNTKNQGGGFNQFHMVDMDESARMISRANLAVRFEQMALRQVGISDQRLGDIGKAETKGGADAAIAKSYTQTRSKFTDYANFKRRVLTMDLEMAQFVASQQDEVKISYINDDLSRAFLKIAGTDLLLRDLDIYISDSQETIRVLETLRQLALNNNTSDASMDDLATIISSNSVGEIREQLKAAQERRSKEVEADRQHQLDLQEQALEAQAKEAQVIRDTDNQNKQLDRENEIKVAEIKALGFTSVENPDVNNNGELDLAEQADIAIKQSTLAYDTVFRTHDVLNKREEVKVKKKQLELQAKAEQTKANTEKEKLKVERENMKNDLQIAKINLKGRAKAKPKK